MYKRQPATVRGAFDFRGQPVPLIDLSQLALGQPSRDHLSTRIVLVHCPDGRGGSRLLGLVAEHVTETFRRQASDFRDAGRPSASCDRSISGTGWPRKSKAPRTEGGACGICFTVSIGSTSATCRASMA